MKQQRRYLSAGAHSCIFKAGKEDLSEEEPGWIEIGSWRAGANQADGPYFGMRFSKNHVIMTRSLESCNPSLTSIVSMYTIKLIILSHYSRNACRDIFSPPVAHCFPQSLRATAELQQGVTPTSPAHTTFRNSLPPVSVLMTYHRPLSSLSHFPMQLDPNVAFDLPICFPLP